MEVTYHIRVDTLLKAFSVTKESRFFEYQHCIVLTILDTALIILEDVHGKILCEWQKGDGGRFRNL